MAKEYSVRFNQFYGGLAKNPYFVGEGQFIDAKNCDLRSKAPLVVPAIKPDGTSFDTGTDNVHTAVDNLLFGDNGKVWNTSGTLTHTVASSNTIYSATKFRDRIVFIYEVTGGTTKLGYYDGSSWTDDWNPSGWNTNSWGSGTAYDAGSDGNAYPMVAFLNKVYIGRNNDLLSVDTDDVVREEQIDLEANVKGLSVQNQMLRIFLENGTILYWDGTTGTNYNEKVTIDTTIRSTFSNGSLNYIIGGSGANSTEFYITSGYEGTDRPIYNKDHWFELKTAEEWSNGKMAYGNDTVYLPWYFSTGTDTAWVYSLYKNPFNDRLTLNYQRTTSSNDSEYSEITMLHFYEDKLYIGYQDSAGNNGVDIIDTDPDQASSNRYANAYIIAPVFDGQKRNIKKNLKELKYYWQVGTADTATVYINTDKFYKATANRRKQIIDWLSGYTQIADFNDTDSSEQNDRYGTGQDIEFYAAIMKIDLDASVVLSELEALFVYRS